jgi:hypothetical protein
MRSEVNIKLGRHIIGVCEGPGDKGGILRPS